MRILPYVVAKEVTKNGQRTEVLVNNLTNTEIKNMSCESKMLWQEESGLYIINPPIIYNAPNGVRDSFCYVFDELSDDEKEKYQNRTVLVTAEVVNEKVKKRKKSR